MAVYMVNITFLTNIAGEWLLGVERLMVSLLVGYVAMSLDNWFLTSDDYVFRNVGNRLPGEAV
jgi:hypothetical protein